MLTNVLTSNKFSISGILLLAFLLTGFPGDLQGDNPKLLDFYVHRTWREKDGLEQSTIISIAQTRDGYIWLGTFGGLIRFDGLEFITVQPEFRFTVLSLCVDQHDNLWVGTHDAGIICYKKKSFYKLDNQDKILNQPVNVIRQTRDGRLWAGTAAGLFRIENHRAIAVRDLNHHPLPRVYAIAESQDKGLWIGTINGLYKVTHDQDHSQAILFALPGMSIRAMAMDKLGGTWIGTLHNGLFYINQTDPPKKFREEFFKEMIIRSLCLDNQGLLWIGAEGQGLCRVNPQAPGGIEQIKSMENTNIVSIFEDKDSNFWLGTNGNWLHLFFDSRIITYTTEQGLSSDDVASVFQDSHDRLWIGTAGFGLNRLQNGRFKNFSKLSGLSGNNILSICEYPEGKLWFGTFRNGLSVWEKKKFIANPQKNRALDGEIIYSIYLDRKNRLWLGTYNGLFLFQNNDFALYHNFKSAVTGFFEDRKGVLWLCTQNGKLTCINNDEIKIYSEKSGSPGNWILSIFEDQAGYLWLGTINGLYLFKNESFKWVGKNHGFPEASMLWIQNDDQANIWLGTNMGIYKIDNQDITAFEAGKISTVHPHHFGLADGMKTQLCTGGNQPSVCKTPAGHFWIPTGEGLCFLNPHNMASSSDLPMVNIDQIMINGKNVLAADPLIIPPGAGNVRITYTGIDYKASQGLSFSVKLAGLDDKWTLLGALRTINYLKLKPGPYWFLVQAVNKNKKSSRNAAVLHFILKPHFYQTVWFLLLWLLLGILLLIGIGIRVFKKGFAKGVAEQKKYQKSTLTDTDANRYVGQILDYMQNEKPYLDQNFTIHLMAEKLGLASFYISQILSEKMNQNYYDFVNQYRIKDAQGMLKNPDFAEDSVINIAFNVGFNTKSSFNRVFKKYVHMTPTEYRKQHCVSGKANRERSDKGDQG